MAVVVRLDLEDFIHDLSWLFWCAKSVYIVMRCELFDFFLQKIDLNREIIIINVYSKMPMLPWVRTCTEHTSTIYISNILLFAPFNPLLVDIYNYFGFIVTTFFKSPLKKESIDL